MIAGIDIDQIVNEYKEKIKTIDNEKKVIEQKNIFIKKNIDPFLSKLKESTHEQKKEIGIFINVFKKKVDEITSDRLTTIKIEKENSAHVVDYNILLNTTKLTKGNSHPLSIVARQIRNFFKKYNFTILDSDEIVSIEENFDWLNIGKNHPARNVADSFYLSETKLLRTHCTSGTARFIHDNKSDDIRILNLGNVYRKDDDDPTHSHQFMQADIVWIKQGLSVENLKWFLHEMLKEIFDDLINLRFRLSYFPFTEPSFEVDISCPYCHGNGNCKVCKNTGWIEIMGAGMIHQNVLKEANIKKITTGFAAGIGIERIAMIKYGISDIRDLYSNNFKFLNQFKKEDQQCI